MTRQELIGHIRTKKSYLCVGLDTDVNKLPGHLLHEENPVLSFNQAIIEATQDYCVAYKVNTAFYEAQGIEGWQNLIKTFAMIPNTHFIIADAKRGDIGNTSHQYAIAFFEKMQVDALTVSPYMGHDSLSAFLAFENKWTIVLGLTSNKGADDFEMLKTDGGLLFEDVIRKVSTWGTEDNLMFVTGATQANYLKNIRQLIPNHFLLIPGVGSQGGSLEDISRVCLNDDVGILVNASRSVLYASGDRDFASAAASEAKKIRDQMILFL